MATIPVPFSEVRATVAAWHESLDEGWSPLSGSVGGPRTALAATQEKLSMPRKAVQLRLDMAVALGLKVRNWRRVNPEWAAAQELRYRAYDQEYIQAAARFTDIPKAKPEPRPAIDDPVADVVDLLRRGPMTQAQVAEHFGLSVRESNRIVEEAKRHGAHVYWGDDGCWHLEKIPVLGSARDEVPELVTDANGRLLIGAMGDTHLCSKYERLDCLNEYYDRCQERGIATVLHAGNWIDGEFEGNRHDLRVHGMDAQMRYMAEHYPQRPGVSTWAVTGADHEGWYANREGVDVGRYAEHVMKDAGRNDWRDLGFMESFIRIRHPETNAYSMLHLMHPGGGSAYALSYTAQKIVEGYDSGVKPAVLLIGHYHKFDHNEVRGVHAVQVGCFQDQTSWMRQRKLMAMVGGVFLSLEIDPRTGAIVEAGVNWRSYHLREFTNGRWSKHGDVRLAKRSPVGG